MGIKGEILISLNEILKILMGLIIWFAILTAINTNFTQRPILWSLVQLGGILILIFLIPLSIEVYKRHRSKYCEHKSKRSDCKICLELMQKLQLQHDEERMRETIKIKANELIEVEMKKLKLNLLRQKENLLKLSPKEFEDAIAEMYRKLGYYVQQTPYSNDGGKDLIMFLEQKKYIVECKRYSPDQSIGRPLLQKFLAAVIEEKADLGIFVTTSEFTETALEYAEKFNIKLVNGSRLTELMSQAYPDVMKTFRIMCLECGDIVEFLLHSDKAVFKCKNNHIVPKRIPDVFNYRFRKKMIM